MTQGFTISVCGAGHIHVGMTDADGATTEAVLDVTEATDLGEMLLNAADEAAEVTGEDDEPLVSSEVH